MGQAKIIAVLTGLLALHKGGDFISHFITKTGRAGSDYAPLPTLCPSGSLVRSATSLADLESTYVKARHANADKALASWLTKTDPGFNTSIVPTVALSISGGGLRSLLTGAGIVQAFDSRDSNASTNGILQSLMYQSGLSGGGWLTLSMAGNNWPTISYLQETLFNHHLPEGFDQPLEHHTMSSYWRIIHDVAEKRAAGFKTTAIDPYGRLLSYALLHGENGGARKTLSGVTSYDNFRSHKVPFPIITALGMDTTVNECVPGMDAAQYEFTPYEFGSWDAGINAFMQMEYLGTRLINGTPKKHDECIKHFDNIGYLMGTTSDLFGYVCKVFTYGLDAKVDLATPEDADLSRANKTLHEQGPDERHLFGQYPNPFHNRTGSPLVDALTELALVDGGLGGQVNPIWPFLRPERHVDVLIVNDNRDPSSNDRTHMFPNGADMRTTYTRAQALGLTKMPYIPPTDVFLEEHLDKEATFFGCNDTLAMTIVYLPNQDISYASNTSSNQFEYKVPEIAAMIKNGHDIATQEGNDPDWAKCLGCALQLKTGTKLPNFCKDCLDDYCYETADDWLHVE